MLASTVHAFAALTASGGVVAWGGNAGTVPVEIANRTDLVTLAGNGFAFAALTASGGVVTWGDSRYGGSIPEATQPLLTEVVAIYTSEYAFCALKADNTVVVWGYADAGNMSNVPASLQDNISYYQE
ncbi:hypothetical protein [Kluyvera intermedia]|uniref:hypothetical protein n=1 Tax=Kluyvera intermedia TaxID=61648 RepID=UPI003524BE72